MGGFQHIKSKIEIVRLWEKEVAEMGGNLQLIPECVRCSLSWSTSLVSGSQRKKPTALDDPLNFPLLPPRGWTFWLVFLRGSFVQIFLAPQGGALPLMIQHERHQQDKVFTYSVKHFNFNFAQIFAQTAHQPFPDNKLDWAFSSSTMRWIFLLFGYTWTAIAWNAVIKNYYDHMTCLHANYSVTQPLWL